MKSISGTGNNETGEGITSSVAVYAQTDVGKVRSTNEDYIKVLVGKDAPPEVDAIMVVADGMGGHAAGEVASEMAVEGMVRLLTSHPADATTPAEDYSLFLGQLLGEVNTDVCRAGQNPEYQGMGTTCTAAVLKNNQLFLAHVGDSRGYVLVAGSLLQITRDHNWVSEQIEAGNLTSEQIKNHPYRNVVTRAIGIDENITVDTFIKNVDPGDRVLLCSDGLHSVVSDNDIESVLATGDVKSGCDRLIALANANGGPDNISVMVADIGTSATSNSGNHTKPKRTRNKKSQTRRSWFTRIINKLNNR